MKYRASDHTFVICAFGESIYIEECIKSLLAQIVKTNIIMCTSTPSKYLYDLAEKYGIKIYVNNDKAFKSNIAADWNYALECVSTPIATIAHQDDIYKPCYSKRILEEINRADKPIIAFTDYAELRDNKEISNIKNLNIKRIMLSPLKIRSLWSSVFVRRRILSFGSAICCPSVTYVKPNLPQPLFVSEYKVSLDWQLWERLSKLKGEFVFVNAILMIHRIHGESETTRNIQDNNRSKEDFEMLCRFWPKWVARLIECCYKKSEKQNNL